MIIYKILLSVFPIILPGENKNNMANYLGAHENQP